MQTDSWQATEYDLTELAPGAEYDLNPTTGRLVYSDLPVFFDAMSVQLFMESDNPVTLFLYDFAAQEVQAICEANCSDAQVFWVYDGFEYMLGIKARLKEDVVALADAAIENSVP